MIARWTNRRRLLAAWGVVACGAFEAGAQVVWGPWVGVPTSQCACMGCSISMYEPPGCTLTLNCQRRDSTPSVEMGAWTRFDSDPVECEYCPACCADSPCACQGMPGTHACDQAKIEGADALSQLTLAPCLGADAPVIEAALFGACFYTGGTHTQCCDAVAPLCTTTTTTAYVAMWLGSKVIIDHEWRTVRVFTGTGCDLAGTYTVSCGGATSGVIADVVDVSSSGCDVATDPCGPACP